MAADTYASLTDLRVAAYMNMRLLELLHQKLDLRQTITEIPFQDNLGSAATKIGLWQPVDVFAAPGEDTAATVTNITDATATLTVAHYRLQREITDLAIVTGGPGIEMLVQAMVVSQVFTIGTLITAAFTSLATTAGTTNTPLIVSDIYTAQFALQLNNNEGPFSLTLHGKQYNDFQSSLRGETGAVQFNPSTDAQLAIKGEGFKGRWHEIDIFTHSTVTSDGTDRTGAMYGRQCFGFAEAPVARILPQMAMSQMPGGAKMVVEIVRGSVGASAGKTFIVGHYFPAVSELEDLRGVKVKTAI